MYLKDFKTNVPEDFLLNYLVGSFAETIKWWIKNKTNLPSDVVAEYFMRVIETH